MLNITYNYEFGGIIVGPDHANQSCFTNKKVAYIILNISSQ